MLAWAGLIVGVDFVLVLLGTLTKFSLAAAVATIGFVTFFGMLALANRLSENPALVKGEMRKAMAAAFTAVYLAIVALSQFAVGQTAQPEVSKTIVSHFTYLMAIIVVFYFASSAVRDYLKTTRGDED
jgi:hypothetical protein